MGAGLRDGLCYAARSDYLTRNRLARSRGVARGQNSPNADESVRLRLSSGRQKSPSIAPLEDVQRDLVELRKDVSRLSKEVSAYVSDTGRQALRNANERLEDAVRERPILAVAIAGGLGLLFGAVFWRR